MDSIELLPSAFATVEVVAAATWVSQLDDLRRVQHPVDLSVPRSRQPVADPSPEAGIDRYGPVPGREVAAIGEPGDVTDLDQKPDRWRARLPRPRPMGRTGVDPQLARLQYRLSVRLIFLARCGAIGVMGLPSADAVEGVEVLGVGVGEGMEVLLGGGDLGVAHPVHHGLEVGAS